MKRVIVIVMAAMALLLANPAPGLAQGGHRGGGHPSGGGGGHPSGGYPSGGHGSGGYSHGGYYGGGYHRGGYYGGGYHRGGYYGGGYYRGGYYNGSHGYYSGSLWIGTGWGPWWWGAGYPYYYPYYPYYYPYYAAPPAVIQQQPTQYIERDQEGDDSDYWYFCRKPEGYYPYVKRCPNGWLRVIPSNAPPDLQK